MKKLTIEEVRIALRQMEALEEAHPKAQVQLNMESGSVDISYPLTENFWEINKLYKQEPIDRPLHPETKHLERLKIKGLRFDTGGYFTEPLDKGHSIK